MSAYIDKEAFIKEIVKIDPRRLSTKTIGEALDRTPVADVVEVVRCKDCKCYEPHGNGTFGLCTNKKCKGIRAEVDYCSYGERREENER